MTLKRTTNARHDTKKKQQLNEMQPQLPRQDD
jgi:hypothetical protein